MLFRSYVRSEVERRSRASIKVRLQPDTAENRELVLDYLETETWQCQSGCFAIEIFRWPDGLKQFALIDSHTSDFTPVNLPRELADAQPAERANLPVRYEFGSEVELRDVKGRQIYVDGKPFGEMIALPGQAESE